MTSKLIVKGLIVLTMAATLAPTAFASDLPATASDQAVVATTTARPQLSFEELQAKMLARLNRAIERLNNILTRADGNEDITDERRATITDYVSSSLDKVNDSIGVVDGATTPEELKEIGHNLRKNAKHVKKELKDKRKDHFKDRYKDLSDEEKAELRDKMKDKWGEEGRPNRRPCHKGDKPQGGGDHRPNRRAFNFYNNQDDAQ